MRYYTKKNRESAIMSNKEEQEITRQQIKEETHNEGPEERAKVSAEEKAEESAEEGAEEGVEEGAEEGAEEDAEERAEKGFSYESLSEEQDNESDDEGAESLGEGIEGAEIKVEGPLGDEPLAPSKGEESSERRSQDAKDMERGKESGPKNGAIAVTGTQSNTLFIANMRSRRGDDAHFISLVERAFRSVGPCRLTLKGTGTWGFLKYREVADAQKAFDSMQDLHVDGVRLTVRRTNPNDGRRREFREQGLWSQGRLGSDVNGRDAVGWSSREGGGDRVRGRDTRRGGSRGVDRDRGRDRSRERDMSRRDAERLRATDGRRGMVMGREGGGHYDRATARENHRGDSPERMRDPDRGRSGAGQRERQRERQDSRDPDRGRARETRRAPSGFRVGELVEVNFKGRGRYYPATIIGQDLDGNFEVLFRDGGKDSRVKPAKIKYPQASAANVGRDTNPPRSRGTGRYDGGREEASHPREAVHRRSGSRPRGRASQQPTIDGNGRREAPPRRSEAERRWGERRPQDEGEHGRIKRSRRD
ncbi:unnamed protein product [Chrysoparadoxa australica]